MIEMKRDTYYFYNHTPISKPEKKYSQTVNTYIGIITRKGNNKKRKHP